MSATLTKKQLIEIAETNNIRFKPSWTKQQIQAAIDSGVKNSDPLWKECQISGLRFDAKNEPQAHYHPELGGYIKYSDYKYSIRDALTEAKEKGETDLEKFVAIAKSTEQKLEEQQRLEIEERGKIHGYEYSDKRAYAALIVGLDPNYGWERKFLKNKEQDWHGKHDFTFDIREVGYYELNSETGSGKKYKRYGYYDGVEWQEKEYLDLVNAIGNPEQAIQKEKDRIGQERKNKGEDAIKISQGLNLPELTGTEKQVRWANQLRLEFLNTFDRTIQELYSLIAGEYDFTKVIYSGEKALIGLALDQACKDNFDLNLEDPEGDEIDSVSLHRILGIDPTFRTVAYFLQAMIFSRKKLVQETKSASMWIDICKARKIRNDEADTIGIVIFSTYGKMAKKVIARENKKAEQIVEAEFEKMNLPQLTGTQKQINWASQIKEERIKEFICHINRIKNISDLIINKPLEIQKLVGFVDNIKQFKYEIAEELEKILKKLVAETSAKEIIESKGRTYKIPTLTESKYPGYCLPTDYVAASYDLMIEHLCRCHVDYRD